MGDVGLEGPGAEQKNAVLCHTATQQPQPAPPVRAPCSRATATLTEPATRRLADSSSRQAVITREAPTRSTGPWRPLDSVIQTVGLFTAS